jgi:hypothetical protein
MGKNEEDMFEDEFSDDIDGGINGSDNAYNDDIFNDDGSLSNDFSDFGGDMGGGSSPMERYNDLLKDLTKFDKYLKQKANGWLGMVWDQEKGKYVKDVNLERVMNFKGVAHCINFLSTYVRDNNILTYIRKDDYKFITYDIYRIFLPSLLVKMEDFEIKSNADLLNIATEVAHSAQLILMGAGEGKYTQFLGTATNRSESVVVGDRGMGMDRRDMPAPAPKKGFFGSLKKVLGGEE